MFSYVRSFHCTPPRRPSAETRRARHRVGTAARRMCGESLHAISNMLLVSSLMMVLLYVFMQSICGCGAAACQVNAESRTTTTQNQVNDDEPPAAAADALRRMEKDFFCIHAPRAVCSLLLLLYVGYGMDMEDNKKTLAQLNKNKIYLLDIMSAVSCRLSAGSAVGCDRWQRKSGLNIRSSSGSQ